MAITATLSDDSQELIIKIKGRFDFSSLQVFRNSYENHDIRPKTYVIDLAETDYLDSSALGMLLTLRDYAGGDSSSIKIINCNPDVKKILLITKLHELFRIE